MISADSATVFLVASTLLALTPGPDNLFVLTQSALYGKSSGVLITLGLCTGLLVHTLAVALGVAAVIQTSSLAFYSLKILGGLYLLYLAWQAFTAPTHEEVATSNKVDKPTTFQLYRRGIIMNVTNPKVTIFFLAFLPQFVDAKNGFVTLQIIGLGLLFIISTFIIFGSIAIMAGNMSSWLTQSKATQVYLNRTASIIFLGLSIKLMTTSYPV